MLDALTAIGFLLFGLAIGSFLNVCIVRLPGAVSDHETSILRACLRQLRAISFPPSACPRCRAKIKPYDNVPVLSYLLLRGRCRACRAPISPLYPAVEGLTALLFLICYFAFGLSPAGVKWSIFCSMMAVLVCTDLRERILPDLVTLGGTLLGFITGALIVVGDGSAFWLASKLFAYPPPLPVLSLADALLGAALGSGALWLVAEGYFRLRGREGMGLGDVKMMALIGSFLGPKLTVLTLFLGSLTGSVLGLVFIFAFRKEGTYELPFGVFLAVGALLSIFFGGQLIAWYASLLI